MTAAGTSDFEALQRFTQDSGRERELRALHARSAFRSAASLGVDWLLILGSALLVWRLGWYWAPVAIVVIGNRQRALVVLIHEASHYNLFRRRRANDVAGNLLLAWPMLNTIARYRGLHVRHHQHLGDPDADTDYLHSEEGMRRGWWWMYRRQVLDPGNLQSAFIGALPVLAWRDRAAIAAWWAIVLTGVGLAAGATAAGEFLVLWVVARATVYHAIINFVIISDHVGLTPGSVLGFTRNHPPRGALKTLLHPHENGWHLVHHLLPAVPYHALPRAHQILSGWAAYAGAAHCATYFRGPASVIGSWVGRDASPAASAPVPETT